MNPYNCKYDNDIQIILSKRHENGGDFWTSPEGATGLGGPFSTLEACNLLVDLGYDSNSDEICGAVSAIFRNQKDDGNIRTFTSGTLYPCQTANAAKVLCKLGYAKDTRLVKTYEQILNSQQSDGGWRCNASLYGKGPETLASNPGPSLTILDIFRYTPWLNTNTTLDKAVEFLLKHWETKAPLGPCHYGIGSQFMRLEFPIFRYNLLNYVFVLSFYKKARADLRFMEAFKQLEAKLEDDQIIIEYSPRKLKDLISCKTNKANEIATRYYQKILANLREPA